MHGVITGLKAKLNYSPNLYVGEGISERRLHRMKKKLCHRPLLMSVYLIVFPENDADQLEIISSRQLLLSYYQKLELSVVGLAKNKDDAVELIVRMTEDCLADRMDCSLKEFLSWQ